MEFTSNDLNKTLYVKKKISDWKRSWYKIDAKWKTLWRLSVEIAKRIMWKNKSYYNEFWDVWNYVIVENADKIKVTWKKLTDKNYYKHTWYKWHLRVTTLSELLEKKPEKALWFAVRGMLPKNKLRDQRMKRLKLYKDLTTDYNHLNPEIIKIDE